MPRSSHHCSCRAVIPVSFMASSELKKCSTMRQQIESLTSLVIKHFYYEMFQTKYTRDVRSQEETILSSYYCAPVGQVLRSCRRRRSGRSRDGHHYGGWCPAICRERQFR